MSSNQIKQIKIGDQVVSATVEGDLDDEFIVVSDVGRRLAAQVKDNECECRVEESYSFDVDAINAELEMKQFLGFLEGMTVVREINVWAKDQASGEEVGIEVSHVFDDEDAATIRIRNAKAGARGYTAIEYLSGLIRRVFDDLEGDEASSELKEVLLSGLGWVRHRSTSTDDLKEMVEKGIFPQESA